MSSRCSSLSAYGRSTCNDVSGHYFQHHFLSSPFFSPPLTTFLIEGVLGSKLDLLKVYPLEAFWILQAMQAVSECPRQHLAGIIFELTIQDIITCAMASVSHQCDHIGCEHSLVSVGFHLLDTQTHRSLSFSYLEATHPRLVYSFLLSKE